MSKNGKIKNWTKVQFFLLFYIRTFVLKTSRPNSDHICRNWDGSSPDTHLWNKYITKRLLLYSVKCHIFFMTIILQDKNGLIPNNTEFVRFKSDKKGRIGPPSADRSQPQFT